MPLIACLTELATSMLMEQGSNQARRFWVVVDELAALGNLPAVDILMSEGRKYGACVIAGLQSINQLYKNYGQYAGSSIFGQFATKFFFRTDEPVIAKMISNMCGTQVIHHQKKNISFGANEFRDGQSYTEQEQRKELVEYSDIASLNVGECFLLLPVPEARLSRLNVPEAKTKAINPEYIPRQMLDLDKDKAKQKNELSAGTDSMFGAEVLAATGNLNSKIPAQELEVEKNSNNNLDSSVGQEVSMEGLLNATRAEYKNLPKDLMEYSVTEEKVKDEISAKNEEEKSDEELEKDSEVEISSSI